MTYSKQFHDRIASIIDENKIKKKKTRKEDNYLKTTYLWGYKQTQTLIVIALRYVTMSHHGGRKQCRGIKEQYAARILSYSLLSI